MSIKEGLQDAICYALGDRAAGTAVRVTFCPACGRGFTAGLPSPTTSGPPPCQQFHDENVIWPGCLMRGGSGNRTEGK